MHKRRRKIGAEMLFLPEYSMYYAKVNARSKNIEAVRAV